MTISQYTADEGLAIIGGLIVLFMFLINLPLLIIFIIGKLRNFESKFTINNTDAFKSDDFSRMNSIISTIQGLLIVALLIFGIVGGAEAGFASVSSSNLTFDVLILIVPYLQWVIIILICAEILILILERSRKRTNFFKNLFQDYATFYEKNNIPIIGRCQICSRAIPSYYGLDKNLNSEFLTKNSVCFQADGQHIVTMQNQDSSSFISEYKNLYNRIKS
ncbi:MAG: hypothetical protein GF311_17010, partial [Candidatus Lokiarchaeota archaeon]|nr:hypothetical protein [Candidatus Lokiarchaeota archaeon]